jgi:hypothetical protein
MSRARNVTVRTSSSKIHPSNSVFNFNSRDEMDSRSSELEDEENFDQVNSAYYSDSQTSSYLFFTDEERNASQRKRRSSRRNSNESPVIQRHAANLRERRRMQSINEAFEVSCASTEIC